MDQNLTLLFAYFPSYKKKSFRIAELHTFQHI